MADRHVTWTRKAADGTITDLSEPAATWSPRQAEDVIRDIESGAHTYYVDQAGYPSEIEVVEGAAGKSLQTTTDASHKNHLRNLPDF